MLYAMPRSILIQAPAKLNLALTVDSPNQGMHPICSWMVTVSLFDDMLISRLDHDRLSRYAILWHADAKRRSEINWSVTKDLAVRAHLALEQHVCRNLPIQMKLEKRIPVGGGLGGGSSNAAAMLRGANELFELGLSVETLAAIGASLGSDVPFLVHGGSAIVEGVGDTITLQQTNPELHAVIIFPAASCPTARVYGIFDERNDVRFRPEDVQSLVNATLAKAILFNDLGLPALQAAPSLADDLDAVSQLAERPAHITGSGSSLFVICDNQVHAEALAQAIESQLQLPAVSVKSAGW
jgi:4-diphosphocytidyl-2-C-methyl-D-erythritol kinase